MVKRSVLAHGEATMVGEPAIEVPQRCHGTVLERDRAPSKSVCQCGRMVHDGTSVTGFVSCQAGNPCRWADNPKVSQVLASYVSGGHSSVIESDGICTAQWLKDRDLEQRAQTTVFAQRSGMNRWSKSDEGLESYS